MEPLHSPFSTFQDISQTFVISHVFKYPGELTVTFVLLGLLLALCSCLAIYFASPNQRGLTQPLPSGPAHGASLLLILLCMLCLSRYLLPVTAIFVLCTWVMLVLTIMPFVGALLTGFSGVKPNEPR